MLIRQEDIQEVLWEHFFKDGRKFLHTLEDVEYQECMNQLVDEESEALAKKMSAKFREIEKERNEMFDIDAEYTTTTTFGPFEFTVVLPEEEKPERFFGENIREAINGFKRFLKRGKASK